MPKPPDFGNTITTLSTVIPCKGLGLHAKWHEGVARDTEPRCLGHTR